MQNKMRYYVVCKGRVLSAVHFDGKWVALATPFRSLATPLKYREALAFSLQRKQSKVLHEVQFRHYDLQGDSIKGFKVRY